VRILWLTIDHSRRVMDLYSPLRLAVGRQSGVKVEALVRTLDRKAGRVCRQIWSGAGRSFPPMIQCPEMVNDSYDAVMVDAAWLFMGEPWADISIPAATTWGDNHGSMVAEYLPVARDNLDLFFPMLWESFERFHGEAFRGSHAEWLPWAVDPSVFRDYGQEKDIDVLCSGVMGGPYHVRTQLFNAGGPYEQYQEGRRLPLRGRDGFQWVRRPPEDESASYWPAGHDYARLLNQSHMCASCCSEYGYALAKVFEIPAARSVLLSDMCSDVAGLGHVAGETMVELSPELGGDPAAIRAFVHDLLADPDDLARIADNGYRLMHERHTVDVRAAHFVERLRCLI